MTSPDAKDSISQWGYILLADISGYTAYMAGVELEHSHDILTELLELVAGHLRQRFELANIHGDAVLATAGPSQISSGEALLELLESTYADFRDRLLTIRHRSTCTCAACRGVIHLDLKFFVHYGEFIAHSIGGQPDLMGADVTLIRERNLKADFEPAGWRGYAAFTPASRSQLNLTEAMTSPVGEFFGLDLGQRYADISSRRVVRVDRAHAGFTIELPAPPPVVWEWLTDPGKRSEWQTGFRWRAVSRPGGRTGPGARNHCVHGRGTADEMVLDWRPFEYFTMEVKAGPMTTATTFALEPLDDGARTRLRLLMRLPWPLPSPLLRLLGERVLNAMSARRHFETLQRLLVERRSIQPETR